MEVRPAASHTLQCTLLKSTWQLKLAFLAPFGERGSKGIPGEMGGLRQRPIGKPARSVRYDGRDERRRWPNREIERTRRSAVAAAGAAAAATATAIGHRVTL